MQASARAVPDRQPPVISKEDFREVATLAYERAGLVVREEKLFLVSGRIARRANQLGLPDIGAYCRLLRGPEGENEIPQFINALTTNHTSFFREHHHFEHLRTEVLPAIAAAARTRGGWVRIWSAACSTGEEPYTIATVVRRALGSGSLPGLRILATDIDTDVLAAAKRGRYPLSTLDGVPGEYRSMLEAGGERSSDSFTVPPAIAELVTFQHLNLMGRWPMKPGYDVIFCRNVFIYFDGPTKARLVDRYAELLKPGGHLYLGHTEFLTSPHPLIGSVGRTVYRRNS